MSDGNALRRLGLWRHSTGFGHHVSLTQNERSKYLKLWFNACLLYNKCLFHEDLFNPENSWLGAAVAEWLSSWLAEQEVQGSIPRLATWISKIGYLLLQSCDMAEIPLKRRKSSIQPTNQNSCLPRATWIFWIEQIFMSLSKLGNEGIILSCNICHVYL